MSDLMCPCCQQVLRSRVFTRLVVDRCSCGFSRMLKVDEHPLGVRLTQDGLKYVRARTGKSKVRGLKQTFSFGKNLG